MRADCPDLRAGDLARGGRTVKAEAVYVKAEAVYYGVARPSHRSTPEGTAALTVAVEPVDSKCAAGEKPYGTDIAKGLLEEVRLFRALRRIGTGPTMIALDIRYTRFQCDLRS